MYLDPFSAHPILAKVASFSKKEHEPLCMMVHFWFMLIISFTRYFMSAAKPPPEGFAYIESTLTALDDDDLRPHERKYILVFYIQNIS